MALEYGIVSPGRLRQRVAVQSQGTRGVNSDGQLTVGGWVTVPSSSPDGLWAAEIRPASAREITNAGQSKGVISHVITMRYAGQVTAISRILYNTRIFSVVGPPLNADERNRRYDLTALEIQVPVQS